ncbi:STM4015 family protein [Deinococcus aquiradiocola]|uniref:Cytoplasmic protein n=1 Tax=Deinococcus aquiradiocola TaxID=393059 RepID=A0A917PG53_9DEIO|nr:STM4015 family protein [Deinococcus aquiradiocola]GGJ76249.1 hypothetical protein GCM10008939_20580 [Deinococcus aquiradiocola]
MSIYTHLTAFGGYKVTLWEPGMPLGDPATTIHRIAVEYDESTPWADKLQAFLELPGAERTPGLVIGQWDEEIGTGTEPDDMIAALVAAAPRLPALRVLFVNDITSEECEVSWITNGDLGPLLAAYPALEVLGVRGGNALRLGHANLPALHTLILQAGGLSAEVVRDVVTSDFPALTHLELFLGTEDYGATSTPEDLTPLLLGGRFPHLKYLGLKNSDRQDEVAQVVANAPVLDGLEVLDLSLGTLSDEGAAALLGSPGVRGLKRLIVAHHWCSEETVRQLEALGPEVDASDAQEADEDDWRFVSLGE